MNDKQLSKHYLHGSLLKAIQNALKQLGKTTENVTIEDLAAVDEFHIGGRAATEQFLSQLQLASQDYVLDIGCGLGGAARFVAHTYGAKVEGIDLTSEYIETGNKLSSWVKLDEQVHLQQASALDLPFENETFNGSFMIHVGMNIQDKEKLFSEIHRVLKPRSAFGIYDIMKLEEGEINFPVPWASEQNLSFVASSENYQQALKDAGFSISKVTNRQDFALEFFKAQKEKTEALGSPPPLGLHTLMQDTTPIKIKNMIQAISSNHLAPFEIITQKP